MCGRSTECEVWDWRYSTLSCGSQQHRKLCTKYQQDTNVLQKLKCAEADSTADKESTINCIRNTN